MELITEFKGYSFHFFFRKGCNWSTVSRMNYVLILLSLIRNGYCFTKLNLIKPSMRQATWLLSQSLGPKLQDTSRDVLHSQAAQIALRLFAFLQCLTGKLAKIGEIPP